MSVILAVYLLFVHWVGDFLTQVPAIANNKGKHTGILFLHVLAYTIVLVIATIFIGLEKNNRHMWYWWIAMNFSLHLVIDFVTSRYTLKLKENGNERGFFLVLGFDQFLHGASLLITTSVVL